MVFNRARELYELKKKADEVKKILEEEVIEVWESGIKVKIRADQKVMSIEIAGEEDERLKKVINKAIKESQKIAAKKMRGRMGDFGLPGF